MGYNLNDNIPFVLPILSASYEQNNSGNLIPVQFSGTTLTDVTVSQYEVLEGANKWELNVEFDNGEDPLDSTGEVVAGAAFQTQTLSDAKTFTGTYPGRSCHHRISGSGSWPGQSLLHSLGLSNTALRHLPQDLVSPLRPESTFRSPADIGGLHSLDPSSSN